MAVPIIRRPLSQNALQFCKNYVENGYNGKKAYGDAYQNPNEATCGVGSYQLLKDPRVQLEISYMEGTYKSLSYKLGLTKELVVKTLVDMMYANRSTLKKDGTIVVEPDWYARNNAINQYAKLTGDFNEKEIEKKIKAIPIENKEEEGISLSGLTKEELEEKRTEILAKLNS